MREDRSKQHDLGMDKYVKPAADYSMTSRDYVVRAFADGDSGPIVITLPPVSEARGRFYSLLADTCDMTNTVTITDRGHGAAGAGSDSEQWEGDIVLFEDGQGTLLYSDGMKWMLRTFADVEMGSSTRGQYNKAAAEITGMTARGGRFRAEARSTVITDLVNADGVHAQGVAYADLFAQTVNAIYAEAMIKDGATVTTIRGAMIACDSEGTPTAITLMIGCHVRVKSSVQPTTYIALKVENEKFGTGCPVDSFIDIRTVTWAAGDTVATNIIDMSALVGTVTTIIDLGGVTATNLFLVDADGDAAVTLAAQVYTTADGYFTISVGGNPFRMPFYAAVD